jgi:diguanylate cyclase (GGDEF)-like protein/PAS domain S-box-containing protein
MENLSQKITFLNQTTLDSLIDSTEEKIMERFTDAGIKIMGADFGFVWLLDPLAGNFKLGYKTPSTPYEPQVPREHGSSHSVMLSKQPWLVDDPYTIKFFREDARAYIKSLAAIPIFYKDSIYGSIFICFKDLYEFKEEDKSLCSFIGNSAAQAITINRLVTSEHRARLEAEQQKSRFQALIEHSYDVIALISPHGEILDMSTSAARLSGYNLRVLIGRNISEFVHEQDLPLLHSATHEILDNAENPRTLEFRFWHSDGSLRWLEANLVNMVNQPGVGSIVANIRDITERKLSQETILHQALHDSLTGLPNRKEFSIRMGAAIETAKRHKRKMAIMFLDMDRFKSINDTLGHAVGDTLLKVAATRFKACLRAEDTVARFGGDEFLILLNEIHSAHEAVTVAEKILKAVNLPVQVGSHTFHPSVSIGIAIYPYDGLDTHELKKHADMALYHAKEKGRNCYSLYDLSVDSHASEKLALENELRQAMASEQLSLYYQPIISLKTGKVLAMEALVRWQHPTKGLLSPAEFIPLAEESGLLLTLSEYVLKSACRQYKIWEAAGFPKFRMAINLSAQSFTEGGFIENFSSVLEKCGVEPGNLEIEITETVAMSDLETTAENLKQLKKMGVRISIDDFGTGYSSLSYLKRFPIHSLKIDRSFVRQCIVNEQDAGIVRTIVSMAHTLNLKVIAEGVETDQQFNFLTGLGCDAAQGYYISQPLPPEALTGWLEARKLLPKKEPLLQQDPAQEPVKI